MKLYELQSIAAMINRHPSGCIATVMQDHVSVAVPGMGSCGSHYYRFYSTEEIRSFRQAVQLLVSME